jgi:type I restriction enzyme S subunit
MVNNFSRYKLSDICSVIKRGIAPKYTEDKGVSVINQRCIRDYNVTLDNARLNDLSKKKIPDDRVLKCYDILINSTGVGTLGRVAQIREVKATLTVDSHVTIVRLNKPEIDPRFFGWVLKYKQPIFEALGEGSTGQTELSRHLVGDVEIDVPSDKSVQIKIADILDSYEDKLKLNEQTNRTLEKMAQVLFKSWFVDFDPVIDNALAAGINVSDFPDALQQKAEQRKQAQQLPDFKPLSDDIRSLFPSKFEQSEELSIGINSWIPKGWDIVELADITTELRRGISPKYLEEGGIQVINQKCIRNHQVNFSLCRRNNPEIRKVAGRELLLGDLLVNSTGVGTLGRMAQVNNLPEPTVVDSHVTVVRPDIAKCPAHTFGQLMLSNERRVEALGEGSTGQTELSRKILSEQKVIFPPIAITSRIEETFKSYAEKQVSNSIQITTLENLRDTLLPKLMSGEITINKEVA